MSTNGCGGRETEETEVAEEEKQVRNLGKLITKTCPLTAVGAEKQLWLQKKKNRWEINFAISIILFPPGGGANYVKGWNFDLRTLLRINSN